MVLYLSYWRLTVIRDLLIVIVFVGMYQSILKQPVLFRILPQYPVLDPVPDGCSLREKNTQPDITDSCLKSQKCWWESILFQCIIAYHFVTTFLKHFEKPSNPTISVFNPLVMVHPSSFCHSLYLQTKTKKKDSEVMQVLIVELVFCIHCYKPGIKKSKERERK